MKPSSIPARTHAAPALFRLLADSSLSRAALNACGAPLALLEVEKRTVSYVNAAFAAYFGYSEGEEFGKSLAALLLRGIAPVTASLDELFTERYDAILTPASLGVAPKGLSATGDPALCTLWTLLGMPALSLPLMQGAGGLPLGVQLVGRRNFDARLLRTARWLAGRLEAQG